MLARIPLDGRVGYALVEVGTHCEIEALGQALQETGGNRTHAAHILGISIRTLRNKLKEYREANAEGCRRAG